MPKLGCSGVITFTATSSRLSLHRGIIDLLDVGINPGWCPRRASCWVRSTSVEERWPAALSHHFGSLPRWLVLISCSTSFPVGEELVESPLRCR